LENSFVKIRDPKPEIGIYSRQGDKRAARSRRRLQPRKRGLGRVFAALVWSRAPGFNVRLRTRTLVPNFVYKYPGVFQSQGRGVFE